jgi:hypothetical protein
MQDQTRSGIFRDEPTVRGGRLAELRRERRDIAGSEQDDAGGLAPRRRLLFFD